MAWFVKTETFTAVASALPVEQRRPTLEAHRRWVADEAAAGRRLRSGYLVDGDRRPGGADWPPDLQQTLNEYFNPNIKLITSLPAPVICAVNGVAAGAGAVVAPADSAGLMVNEAISALSNLGYTRSDVMQVASRIVSEQAPDSVEDLIRLSLREMAA